MNPTAASPSRPKMYLELVRFSHTIFALPFALMALFLAYGGEWPDLRTTGVVLVCLVAARTAAMAYNRLVDRDIDARNPRTQDRHLPRGAVSATEVPALAVGASLVVVATLYDMSNGSGGRNAAPICASVVEGIAAHRDLTAAWLLPGADGGR